MNSLSSLVVEIVAVVCLGLVGCGTKQSDSSPVTELGGYSHGVAFISRAADNDPSLVLKGDEGARVDDHWHYFGPTTAGLVVYGPTKTIHASKGFVAASIEFEANAWRDNILQPGAICIDPDSCPIFAPGSGRFTAELVYRTAGAVGNNLVVVGQVDTIVNSSVPRQILNISSANFQGDILDLEVRVRNISADQYLDLNVFNTTINVGFLPH